MLISWMIEDEFVEGVLNLATAEGPKEPMQVALLRTAQSATCRCLYVRAASKARLPQTECTSASLYVCRLLSLCFLLLWSVCYILQAVAAAPIIIATQRAEIPCDRERERERDLSVVGIKSGKARET